MAASSNSSATSQTWVTTVRATLAALATPVAELAALTAARGQRALLVGGAVRDALMALKNPGSTGSLRDADVVVLGDALPLGAALRDKMGGALDVNPRFGTASWHHNKFGTLDIATARRERYAHPAALPDVTPTQELREDLQRRDFTLNAIAAELDSSFTLRDPFAGQEALAQRELAVLHDASFIDDPTRLWRGARLAARLQLSWAPHTAELALAAASANVQDGLSSARLGSELALALAEPEPGRVLMQLADFGLLKGLGVSEALPPELDALHKTVAQLVAEAPPWLAPLPSAASISALWLAARVDAKGPLGLAVRQTGLVSTALRPHRQALVQAARGYASAADRIEFAVAMGKLSAQERAGLIAELMATPQRDLALRWTTVDWRVRTEVTAASLMAEGVAPSPAMAQALGAALRSALAGQSAALQRRAALAALAQAT